MFPLFLNHLWENSWNNFFRHIFWAPILFRWYQNTSGCSTGYNENTLWWPEATLNRISWDWKRRIAGPKKIFTWLAANLFFNQFSGDILFSFLVSFTFFYSRFFFFFVACFLKLKMYILIHIRPCRWVSDKKFFTQPIYGNKTFFWPGVSFSEIYDNNRTIIPFSNRSLFWYHSTLIQSLSPQMGQSIQEWTK